MVSLGCIEFGAPAGHPHREALSKRRKLFSSVWRLKTVTTVRQRTSTKALCASEIKKNRLEIFIVFWFLCLCNKKDTANQYRREGFFHKQGFTVGHLGQNVCIESIASCHAWNWAKQKGKGGGVTIYPPLSLSSRNTLHTYNGMKTICS